MGYWGDSCKDGDSPLDHFGEWKDKRGSANAFLKRLFKQSKETYSAFGVLGCARLMLEDGAKVDVEVLKPILEKASKIENGLCTEDVQFFKTYMETGTKLVKKTYKVLVEVRVDAFDEAGAIREAQEPLGIHFNGLTKWAGEPKYNQRVTIKVANA